MFFHLLVVSNALNLKRVMIVQTHARDEENGEFFVFFQKNHERWGEGVATYDLYQLYVFHCLCVFFFMINFFVIVKVDEILYVLNPVNQLISPVVKQARGGNLANNEKIKEMLNQRKALINVKKVFISIFFFVGSKRVDIKC